MRRRRRYGGFLRGLGMSEEAVRPLAYYESAREIELGRGEVISTTDLATYPGDYPVYSSSAIGSGEFGRYGRFMFNEELITWSIDGGGRPFYRPKHRYSVTNVCGYLRITRPDVWNYRYLHALLEKLQSGIQFDYQMKAHPSVIRELYRFRRIPLRDQQLIGEILDTLDTAIHETEAIIAKLKAVKQGLLHDLLTRGIDANGELRPPQVEAPHLYKKSPLGWIPTSWEPKRVGELLSENPRNGIYKPPHLIGRGVLLVGQTAFTEDGSVAFQFSRRAQVSSGEVRQFGLAAGDLLVSRVFATLEGVGLPVIVPDLPEAAVYESNMMRLRVKPGVVTSDVLFHLLKQPRTRTAIRSRAFQSNQASINRDGLCNIQVAVPPWSEQLGIDELTNILWQQLENETSWLVKLKAQRQGLMDDLLTGRVRVTPLLQGAAP